MSDYPAFGKIPRWKRELIVTEKIDGTNGLIRIDMPNESADFPSVATDSGLWVSAGSRNRWLTASFDNFGFAKWVYDNADDLARVLGTGHHYGEWWGAGIQRRYGLDHKRFSLFNTSRWTPGGLYEAGAPDELGVVPVLAVGTQDSVDNALSYLRQRGSVAAPTFRNPEGVVIYHTASRSYFKATLDNDEQAKGAAA